ncbi:hypothetical protein [Patiriisocius sp. Uisw_017]
MGLLVVKRYEPADATIKLSSNTAKTVEEMLCVISRDFSSKDEKVFAIYV